MRPRRDYASRMVKSEPSHVTQSILRALPVVSSPLPWSFAGKARGRAFGPGHSSRAILFRKRRSPSCLRVRAHQIPPVRFEQPRPAEQIAAGNCVDRYRRSVLGSSFNRNRSAFNQVEAVGCLSHTEDSFAGVKMRGQCAISQQTNMMRAQPVEKRMRSDAVLQIHPEI